jgi:hypothetical protein
MSNEPPRAILDLEQHLGRTLELEADVVHKLASRFTQGTGEERRLAGIEQSLRRLVDELKTPRG